MKKSSLMSENLEKVGLRWLSRFLPSHQILGESTGRLPQQISKEAETKPNLFKIICLGTAWDKLNIQESEIDFILALRKSKEQKPD